MKVLDLFNKANNSKRVKLDYKDFYNDAINKEVNLKQHFELWLTKREHKRRNLANSELEQIFTLCDYPWILDSAHKADLLKIENRGAQMRQQDNFNVSEIMRNGMGSLYLLIEVRRDRILDDTLNKLVKGGLNLKKPLRIQFIGEPGVDEGGVRKEFFQLLLRALFDPSYSMFNYNERQVLYWFNGFTEEPPINFELIGILFGLAIYNGIIIDVPLPSTCYKQLLFKEPTLDDFREWQPEIAQSLQYILDYPHGDLQEKLGVKFVIEKERYGEKIDVELKEGGKDVMVSESNRKEYVERYVHYEMQEQCREQLKAFIRGFYRVCDEHTML